MRQATCTLPPGATIAVAVGDRGRTFSAGDVVDLDAELVPAGKDRPAETWATALGPHLEHFAIATVTRRDREARSAERGGREQE